MNHIKKRHAVMLSVVLIVIAGITAVILNLSSSIQEKMENSAIENIKGNVLLVADSVSSIRETHANGIYQMAANIHMDDDLEKLLREGRKAGCFSWAAIVDAATGAGICHDGSIFQVADLACKETALQGERSISHTYMNSQGTWAFTVQCPIYENGKLTGALYADISMEHLGEVLPLSIYNGKGTLYILDTSSKRFIFQPPSTNVHISSKYDLEGFLSDFGDVDKELEQRIYQAIGQDEKLIVQIRFDGVASYLFFWPVKETGWYLCGIVPVASIQQESTAVGHTIQLVTIISFAAACLIMWLVYWNYRRLIRVKRRQEQYRIALFQGISASIGEVVLMYDCATGEREIAFDNIWKILGVNADRFEALVKTEEFRSRLGGKDLQQIISQTAPGDQQESVQKLEWDNPVTGQKQQLRLNILYTDLMGVKKCILSLDDYTTEEKLQDSLRTTALAAQNANRTKSDFLSSMSHEIRTPLNAISGMLQIARKRLAGGGDVTDCMEKAEIASKQLLLLINDVLDISKIESGKMVLEEEWFSLKDLLEHIRITAGVQAEQKGQSFDVDIEDCEGMEVLGDPVRLSQVLMNLLSNAVKYTQEGGCISLQVHRESSVTKDLCRFTFTIQDNGAGMSEDFQKRMFLPFERELDDTGRKEVGTGLGLSIVNNIVSLMGGFLKLESTKGEGSTFDVTIAFQYNSAMEALEEMESIDDVSTDFSGMRVLLAEDNEINREIAVEFLEMANAEVVCAENGKKAFEIFQCSPEYHFNLILMDMQMPVWDGLEATRRIRALSREDAESVLIIAATANAFLEDEKECIAAGMDDYISKPIDMNRLYQKIKKNREIHKL